MLQILFALLAGILTIGAPCILPMLPILLGASVGQHSRWRPLLIVLGFVVSFSAVSLLLSFVIQKLGLSPGLLRNIAIVLLATFAVFMIWPRPFELLVAKLSGTINAANRMGGGSPRFPGEAGQGNMSGLILGLVLGIIWTPCAGPIFGSVLALVATQGTTVKSSILLAAYALGAGIPMLIIAYGSQFITTKIRSIAQYSKRLQQIFGVLILALAISMHFGFDLKIQSALVSYCPAVGSVFEQNLAKQAGFVPGPTLADYEQIIILPKSDLANYPPTNPSLTPQPMD